MSEYRRNEIVSGVFICLALLVLGLFAFRVGRFDLWGFLKGDVIRCESFFLNVKSLESGAVVKVGGQTVGKVTAVVMEERQLEEEQASLLRRSATISRAQAIRAGMMRQLMKVEYELFESTLKIDQASATVSLAADSLLAPFYLELDPGNWDAGNTKIKTLFAASHPDPLEIASMEESGLDELVALAKPILEDVGEAVDRLNKRLFSGENLERMGSLLATAESVFTELREVVARLDDHVLSEDNTARLTAAIQELEKTAQGSSELIAALNRLLDREKDPRLHQIVDDVSQATQGLDGRLRGLQIEMQELVSDLRAVVGENRGSIAESTSRLKRALWHAELALRKIRANPAVLLFGAEEDAFEAEVVDETRLRAGARARPYGQREE